MDITSLELRLLELALFSYAAGSLLIFYYSGSSTKKIRFGFALFLLAVGAHSGSLAVRWLRIGHGPFLNLYEILSSNLWSLSLAFLIAQWRLPEVRASARVVIPILAVIALWLMVSPASDGHLPPTYDTPWLYFHVLFGKLFLGLLLIAVGVSGAVLARTTALGRRQFQTLPQSHSLMILAYRLVAISFLFQTFMLVFGAIWAQDAWGRYWAWDPIETWSFLTWMSVLYYLHARKQIKGSQLKSALIVLSIFVLAFLTFFGVPFVSESPHKGMV